MLAFGAGLAYLVFTIAMFAGHFWLIDANGHVLANDFIDVYAAGNMAAAGHAAQAYDWSAHRAAEVAAAGHNFDGYYGWHYPPPFLFIAVALSALPYLASFVFWIAATLPLYAWAIAKIAQRRAAVLWALAFPAVLLNIYVGQNGFVTAALIGFMLLTLEEQPIVSGVLLGLLTYKPQFGAVIPFALIAAGHWRALASATVTAFALIALSIAAFGTDAWLAFFHSIPHTADMILAHGHAGWNKLQTVYGFLRASGASDSSAWIVQIAVTLLMIAGNVFMWRSDMPFALKAASLAVSTLLATPYAYIYDFPLLAIAIAFLYRQHAFETHETAVLLAAAALIASFPWASAPVGLAASLLVASVVSRRGRKLRSFPGDVALQSA